MGYSFQLPKDKVQAAEVVRNLVIQGQGKRNPKSVSWWLSLAYMEGYREFSHIDSSGGTLFVPYMDESGMLRFRLDEIVSKYQAQLGRLLALNLGPSVQRVGVSLDGMRKSSIAQVVLDSAFPQDKVNRLALEMLPALLLYGTVGLGLWVESEDSMGIELIPPWELLPIPLDVSGPHAVRGRIRVRNVPLGWIKGLTITPGAKSKEYKKIDHIPIQAGRMPIGNDMTGDVAMSMTSGAGGFFVKRSDGSMAGRQKKKDETNEDITQLVEVWTETSDHYLAEYAIYAGMANYRELYRFDHTDAKYPLPVRIVRDVPVGGFWGRSFVEQLIPLNREVEIAASSLFQALSDFDLYGIQLWPTSLGDPVEAQRGQDGLKRIRFEPDYTTPDMKPENIMPAKMVLPHMNGIKTGLEMMDRIANQPTEMMAGGAPGRVDSAAGLGFLYETSGISLSPTAKNIANALSGVYRAMLRILKDIWTDQKVVSVSSLDDSLAGIVLDASSGTMSLSKNAIPFPDEVSVTIASEVPISREQQKFELKESLEKGRITLEEYSFEVRKRGLDLPVGMEREWQNYRRAMLENILLFGDGDMPGKVIVSSRDIHRIHLNVLDTFMSRPEFYSASKGVRDAFVAHYEEHKTEMGAFPDQLEYPEEAAGMMMQEGMPPFIPAEGETTYQM